MLMRCTQAQFGSGSPALSVQPCVICSVGVLPVRRLYSLEKPALCLRILYKGGKPCVVYFLQQQETPPLLIFFSAQTEAAQEWKSTKISI